MPGLPPAAPDLGERAGVAEDLADLGLALRDAQEGQVRSQLGGGAIAAGAAGQRVQAGAPQDRGRREVSGQGRPAHLQNHTLAGHVGNAELDLNGEDPVVIHAMRLRPSSTRSSGKGDLMKHTNAEIEDAARRFEQLAEAIDPADVTAEDLSDLRAVAEAAEQVRRDEAW